jgi:hypothetical protein
MEIMMNMHRKLYFASLGLAFIGALIAVLGAGLVFQDQVQIQGSGIWPLPGLVLLDWILLGILGFLGAWLSDKPDGSAWLKALWFVVGACVPLVILGAFSIGLFVLFTFLLNLAGAVILTIQRKGKAREHVGWLFAGMVINLVIVWAFIFLDGLIASYHIAQG